MEEFEKDHYKFFYVCLVVFPSEAVWPWTFVCREFFYITASISLLVISLFKLSFSSWEFPGGSVVRTQSFHCQDPGSIPGQGTKITEATQCNQKNKTSFLFPDAVLVGCMFLETSISSRLSNLLADNCSWYPLMASYISMMSVVISPLSFLIFLVWVPSLLGEPSQRFSISFLLTLGLFVLLFRILLTGILDYLIFFLVF